MLVWSGFLVLITIFLALDLGVFNKSPHAITTREALKWTTVWVTISLLFSVFVYYAYEYHWFGIGVTVGEPASGKAALINYLTGYLVEQSLSMDNIFVIAVIFNYFKIPKQYQHRVLFWGIIGAVVFRGLMIGVGSVLIHRFEWMIYVFGGILLYTSWKMLRPDHENIHPDANPLVNFFKKYFPVVRGFYGEKFFIKKMGKTVITPLFIALLVVETTDVIFAFDSIPAIFAITTDPFLVFTSNIFAILGLRSLYFVLASVLDKFHYLKYSLAAILAFVGLKMIFSHQIHLPEGVSLVFIVVSLAAGIVVSMYVSRKEEKLAQS
jgi:tellurite resistance protein TerC